MEPEERQKKIRTDHLKKYVYNKEKKELIYIHRTYLSVSLFSQAAAEKCTERQGARFVRFI